MIEVRHQRATIAELIAMVQQFTELRTIYPARGARLLCEHLSTLPAETWSERWSLFEATSMTGDWLDAARPDLTVHRHVVMRGGLLTLCALDVVRPSYQWMHNHSLRYGLVPPLRHPDDARRLREELETLGVTERHVQITMRMAGKLQARLGKRLTQLTAKDLMSYPRGVDATLQPSRNGLSTLWKGLHRLGWLTHESRVLPSIHRQRGQLSSEELVARHGVTGEFAEVLAEYLKHRSAGMDYGSRRVHADYLVRLFWKDILDHHPEQQDFRLTPEQADAWKQRLRFRTDGTPRGDVHPVLFAVRGFYLDVAQWALQDSYWARWAAATPIHMFELKGYAKFRRQQNGQTKQRTRVLAPLLPQVVAKAEQNRKETADALAAALEVKSGGEITFRGQQWAVYQRGPTSTMRLRRDGVDINLTSEEDCDFWAWACVEVLRLTGVRSEELLEITHLAIQPYRVPSTGETIPLLHIVPSKTDTERLLVAGPELVHVLAQVISRVRDADGQVPLSQRWDVHEKLLSDPMPHLFVKRIGGHLQVISPNTVVNHLRRILARTDLTVAGTKVRFTPQDLRRVFATEALSSGLPPHIVQVLMGHKSIATTQGYAAIYPEDVIRHHRTFLAQRRETRPSEEYREPTPQEWEEFEAHFVTRKVSLGTCGRAYGTNCHHEHACVRCSLLRPDPNQIDRLRDIATNLGDRITEATDQGWLGEVEGLKVSLAAAELKLAQLDRMIANAKDPVALGLPRSAARMPPTAAPSLAPRGHRR